MVMKAMAERYDAAVIGAGPAGLAAACTAADAGLSIALLDLNERIGGQYYRHAAEQQQSAQPGAYHHGWSRFVQLRERFDQHLAAGRVVSFQGTSVWSVDRDRHCGREHAPAADDGCVIRAVQGERERLPLTLRARVVVIATGAYDRQLPFPGWTLPGVMAAGGAQALLKGSNVAPGRRAVVAGTGPFLLAVADSLLTAGVEVAAVVEANAPWQMARHPRALPGLLSKLPEAVNFGRALVDARVPYRMRHAVVAAHGGRRLEAVAVASVDSDWHPIESSRRTVACDLLAVGYGFTPQIELALAAGCEHGVDRDGSLVIRVDRDTRTSVPGIYAAGETTGVGGVELALTEGLICGTAIVRDLVPAATAVSDRDERTLRLRRRLLRDFAEAMHAAHPLRPGWRGWLADDTLICRCEEVPYVRVREALTELGARDARAVKLLSRPGMGWCQGRVCGCAVAALTAHHNGRELAEADLLAMSKRVIGSPVPIAQLADDDSRGPLRPL